MAWPELELDAQIWTLPATRTKNGMNIGSKAAAYGEQRLLEMEHGLPQAVGGRNSDLFNKTPVVYSLVGEQLS